MIHNIRVANEVSLTDENPQRSQYFTLKVNFDELDTIPKKLFNQFTDEVVSIFGDKLDMGLDEDPENEYDNSIIHFVKTYSADEIQELVADIDVAIKESKRIAQKYNAYVQKNNEQTR